MPSATLNYVPGSGFASFISGNPWSGRIEPVGGLQLRADKNNSGNIYISLSGANVFSGQYSTLVGSGGPTITSGSWQPLSGITGNMDGFQVGPGDAYFIPKMAFQLGGGSGSFQICAGADPTCSGGFGRIYWEAF